jgi:hypothetical protein
VVNLNQVVPRLKWEWAGNHGDLVNRENREAATEVARVEEVETVAVNEAAAAGTATVAAVLSIVVETAVVIAEATEVVTVAVSSGAYRSVKAPEVDRELAESDLQVGSEPAENDPAVANGRLATRGAAVKEAPVASTATRNARLLRGIINRKSIRICRASREARLFLFGGESEQECGFSKRACYLFS